MPFDFQAAVRTNTAIILALAGASGSGKTKSALELAVGLAGETGKILVIDTEGRRALHYADEYRFHHYEWRPPFTPAALGELLREAERQGFAVVIVDSMSDEHEGEGGLCDMAEAELAKQQGAKNSGAAWGKPKAEHKHHVVRWLRQTQMHVIFCLRADEKVRFEKVVKDGRERTVIIPVGWQPIAEKRLLYDVTTSLLFTPAPGRAGIPEPIKLYDKHAPFFPADRRVARAAGAALARWAAGGVASADPDTILEQARSHAKTGKAAFTAYWQDLSRLDRAVLRLHMAELQALAEAADTTSEETGDTP
jgi:energy-coupling factor transporter ATP-binding protein EcfA2